MAIQTALSIETEIEIWINIDVGNKLKVESCDLYSERVAQLLCSSLNQSPIKAKLADKHLRRPLLLPSWQSARKVAQERYKINSFHGLFVAHLRPMKAPASLCSVSHLP